MELWAANTLRTLGIIMTAGFVLVTSLILLLLSMCAGGASHPDQAAPFILGAIVVVVAGVSFIVWLAGGIVGSHKLPEPVAERLPPASPVDTAPASPRGFPMPAPPEPQFSAPLHPPLLDHPAKPAAVTEPGPSVPLHLSPLGRQAIDRLVLALGAQIFISAVAWIFNQLHFWSARRPYAPRNWTLALLAPFILFHVPYAILMYFLFKRPDRRTFTYALAVPAVMILEGVLSLGVVSYYFVHEPRGFLLLILPWLIHILILVLAYQAIQQVGLHPEPSSIMVAAVVTFVFFSLIHVITPLLYRFTWR
jgi:hypothetical protein